MGHHRYTMLIAGPLGRRPQTTREHSVRSALMSVPRATVERTEGWPLSRLAGGDAPDAPGGVDLAELLGVDEGPHGGRVLRGGVHGAA